MIRPKPRSRIPGSSRVARSIGVTVSNCRAERQLSASVAIRRARLRAAGVEHADVDPAEQFVRRSRHGGRSVLVNGVGRDRVYLDPEPDRSSERARPGATRHGPRATGCGPAAARLSAVAAPRPEVAPPISARLAVIARRFPGGGRPPPRAAVPELMATSVVASSVSMTASSPTLDRMSSSSAEVTGSKPELPALVAAGRQHPAAAQHLLADAQADARLTLEDDVGQEPVEDRSRGARSSASKASRMARRISGKAKPVIVPAAPRSISE